MKYITLLILLNIQLSYYYCQPPASGTYITNSNLDKFEGTWFNYTSTDTLIVKLKKVKYYYSDKNYFRDILIGVYKYKKNGAVVYDYLDKYDSCVNNNHDLKKITLFHLHYYNNNFVSGTISDTIKGKLVKLELTSNNNSSSNPTLNWKVMVREQIIVDNKVKLGITLPKILVLNKH